MIDILHMRKEFSSFSGKVISSSEEVSGRAHFRRLDLGHGHHTAAKKYCDLMGVYFVVLGLASVNGFHVQGMTKDKRDILFGTEIGNPVPGEYAFYSNDDVFSERSNGLQKHIRVCLAVSVQDYLTFLVENA